MILGATGRIGGLVLRDALADDHHVVALSTRRASSQPRERLVVRAGDIRDRRAVHDAVAGVEAVIAALGPRTNSPEDEETLEIGMENTVAAMEAAGVSRLVALSGAAVDVPGDTKPLVDRLVSRLVRRVARHVVAAKQREYAVFAGSRLDWTALRPPLVTDGPAKGYRLDLQLTPGARVTRADVARALVDQVTDRQFVRAAPFVLPPRRS